MCDNFNGLDIVGTQGLKVVPEIISREVNTFAIDKNTCSYNPINGDLTIVNEYPGSHFK
ncbi:hypothetical protein D3C81_1120850 [compost metagenome]